MKKVETFGGRKPLVVADNYSTFAITLDRDFLPNVDVLEEGTVIGEINSSGLGRVYGKTSVASAGSSVNTISVENALPFQAGDTVTVGSNTGLSVDSVDLANDEVTLGTAVTVSAGDTVELENGAETAVGILLDPVKVNDELQEDVPVAVIDYGILYEASCVLLDQDAKNVLNNIQFR